MKTVFSNDMVAHVWAGRTQDEGRNSNSSMYFYKDTIYSYGRHFPMATFVSKKNRKKKTAVLLTTRSYSVTTSQHQSTVRQAIDKDKYKVFHVGDVDNLESNIFEFYGKLRGHINSAKSARSSHVYANGDYSKQSGFKVACHNLKAIRSTLADLKEYADYFGLKWKFDFKTECQDIPAALKHKRKTAATAKKNAPAIERRNKKQRMKRLKGLFQDYFDGTGNLYNHNIPWELMQKLQNNEVATAKREHGLSTLAARRRKQAKAKLKEWFEGIQNQYIFPWDFPIFLRVKGDEVQTTKGATVKLSFIKLAWKKIEQCKRTKSPWKANGHTIRLGHFQIDYITATGDIKAGCHLIKFGPIKHLARKLGYLDNPGQDDSEPNNYANLVPGI